MSITSALASITFWLLAAIWLVARVVGRVERRQDARFDGHPAPVRIALMGARRSAPLKVQAVMGAIIVTAILLLSRLI